MSRFQNDLTGVIVSVADSKDDRFTSGWSAPRESSDTPDDSWKVAELKAYAEKNRIDLGEATKKADILAAITAPEGDDAPAGND